MNVDFGGLAPNQTWEGDPNDFIVRESYIFKPVLADYNQALLGEGSTGALSPPRKRPHLRRTMLHS